MENPVYPFIEVANPSILVCYLTPCAFRKVPNPAPAVLARFGTIPATRAGGPLALRS
jgi:hypothetical protein